jgi:RNA polymerase sigma-70 factor, ECF subfamily
MKRMSSGGAEKLSALYDAHADRLYRLARRLAAGEGEAWDLVQETFLNAASAVDAVPPGAAAEEAWLVRVLVNVRRDQWRREAVRRRHASGQHRTAARPVHPENAILIRSTVWAALDRLSPRRRAIVVMCEIEGRSTADVAAVLGVARVTVRWHLSLARRALAQHLRIPRGDTYEHAQQPVTGRRSAASRTAAQ